MRLDRFGIWFSPMLARLLLLVCLPACLGVQALPAVAAPPAATGYYVLDLFFPDQGRHEVWDASRTKAFLTGFYLSKFGSDITPEQHNAEDRNLEVRLKNKGAGTQAGTIHYVIQLEKLAHVELIFKDAATGKTLEVQPLALCSECFWNWLPHPGTYFAWEGSTPSLRQAIQSYMNLDIDKPPEKPTKIDRSGTFFLRATDASNQVFELPLCRASWHMNNVDPSPPAAVENWEIAPLLQ